MNLIDEIPEFPDFPKKEHCVERTQLHEDNTGTCFNGSNLYPQIRVTGGTGCELIKYHDGDILLVDSIETGEGMFI